MPDPRRFDLDELTLRPGTYFNPQTEVLLIVDDTPDLDHEIFDGDVHGDAEWVLVSDETPVDEHRRDELIEHFQSEHHGAAPRALGDDDVEDEDDELEPDEDLDDED
jgi:hypothetical protein